jgi:hypothetical protein
MAWNDTYRSDLRTHRHHIPPQLPETRGMWVRATIPQYFRNEIINAVTIKAPTLDYFKRYHSKNWHNKAIRWPKAFRVATDVGEGIYEIRSPWVNFTDLSGQKSGPNRTIDYYDAYGNRVTDPSLIPDTFDLEQARFRSVAWYPGAVAYRVQFPQFDEVLVGTDAWNEHVEKVIQMEIMQKSQAMNVRLWDQSREAYVLDYDPDFATQTTANPMSWGSIPYYINSIAWYRTQEAGKIFLNPINEAWIQQLAQNIASNTGWTNLRNALNSTSSSFWYDSSAETVGVDSANMRQQTVGSVNRGVADVPPLSGRPTNWTSWSFAARLQYIKNNILKNGWWMVPSELTIFVQGSGRIEQPQVVYPVARDSSGNPLYPVYNLTDRVWAHPAGGDFRFNPLDLERLYQAAFYNYDVTMPKLAVMHPDTRTYMNQLNMIRTSLMQTRRKFGPADMALDGEFRDLEIFVDMAAPKNIIYLLGVDCLHVAFSDYEGMLNPRELPTQTMVDTLVAWTAYKWMVDNMRVHGIYWGFTVRI